MRYDSQLAMSDERRAVAPALVGALRLLWNLIRFPILAVLAPLEGVLQTVLGGLALLSLVTALFFEYATPVTRFPFWETLTFSAACVLASILYYVLVRVLSR